MGFRKRVLSATSVAVVALFGVIIWVALEAAPGTVPGHWLREEREPGPGELQTGEAASLQEQVTTRADLDRSEVAVVAVAKPPVVAETMPNFELRETDDGLGIANALRVAAATGFQGILGDPYLGPAINPSKRAVSDEERERLVLLFGPRIQELLTVHEGVLKERWAAVRRKGLAGGSVVNKRESPDGTTTWVLAENESEPGAFTSAYQTEGGELRSVRMAWGEDPLLYELQLKQRSMVAQLVNEMRAALMRTSDDS